MTAQPLSNGHATYGEEAKPRKGFFTDTIICIGCKACEVACKEWNGVPDDPREFTGESYDNSGALGANRWRHVAFIEQRSRSAPSTARRTPSCRRRRVSR